MSLSNMKLFIFRVAGELNYFHTVQERRRNVHRVAGCNEHDVRQIEIHFDIVVLEGVVLFRIKHFQERSRRVASVVHTHLIDFVEQEKRVVGFRLCQALKNSTGHGTDVGSSVTADFALISYAA